MLVASEGTKATLSCCSFQLLPNMAIEVREGGSLEAEYLEISSCKQGILAYGGAKQIDISKSTVSNCSHEGIMIFGSFQNAATAMQIEQSEKMLGTRKPTLAQATSEAAVQWARSRGMQLCASISETTVQGCGQFGISIDYGAQACVYACTLTHNDPHCVYVKGGSDLAIAASRLEFASKETKPPWTSLQRKARSNLPGNLKRSVGGSFKQSGLSIGINYNGNISVSTCVMVGIDDSLGIVEEFPLMKASGLNQTIGMYSKPPELSGYSHCQPDDITIPSIADLISHLPPSWRNTHAPRSIGTRSQPKLTALRRPCRSHQDVSWSPTGSQNYALATRPVTM